MPRRAVICLCLLLVHALPPSNGQQVVSDGVEDERQGKMTPDILMYQQTCTKFDVVIKILL